MHMPATSAPLCASSAGRVSGPGVVVISALPHSGIHRAKPRASDAATAAWFDGHAGQIDLKPTQRLQIAIEFRS